MTSDARADRILDEFTEGAYHGDLSCAEHDTIRRALEALDD